MKRPCLRTLDRPIVALWGLEPADLGAVLGAAGILFLLSNVALALVGSAALCLGLRALKAGKPRGAVFALLYRAGIVRWVPAALRPCYLVLPPAMSRRTLRFSAVPGPQDDGSAEAKFFRGKKAYLR